MTKGDDMGCLGNMTAAEKLMALAADWEDRSCGLYVHLREGSEGRWGVNGFSRGSVSEILRDIAGRALEEQADLKMFAERVHGMLWGDGWHDLDEIADRLEEELSEIDRMLCDGTVHPVDDEDCAAAMWVREHGGLDAVKERFERVETWDADKAALWDLCAECGGIDGVRARMMPEGFEWPKYEDGEPVRIGGVALLADKEPHEIGSMELFADKSCKLKGKCTPWMKTILKGQVAKRPAPKVLDADGVEIHVGDTVWHVETGEQCKVVEVDSRSVSVDFRVDGDGTKHTGSILPANLTHRAPVLAADGKPLEVGQTVYVARYEYQKCTVLSFEWMHDDWLVEVENEGGHKFRLTPDEFTHQHPVLDADGVLCREGDEVWEVGSHRRREIVGTHYRDYETGEPLILCDGDDAIPIPATCVTHAKPEPPDSWERIEEDCAKFCIEYCDEHGLLDHGCNAAEGDASTRHCADCGDSCEERMARDLVRRCKALAERGA